MRVNAPSSNESTTRCDTSQSWSPRHDYGPVRRSAQPGPLNYEFTLSSKEGALLILPEGAERYSLKNQCPFLEEAIQHAVDWYDFAEQRLGRIISHDSLYLITGFYKARSWSLASYQHASGTAEVRAQFKAAQVGGGNVSTSYTWDTTHAVDWRVGPSNQCYNGIANQSVFIQGFKIAVRSNILGAKRISVKARAPVVRSQQVVASNGLRWRNIGARLLSSWFSAPAANTPREIDADSNMGMPEESFDNDTSDGDDVTIQHMPQVVKVCPRYHFKPSKAHESFQHFHPSDIINRCLLRSVGIA